MSSGATSRLNEKWIRFLRVTIGGDAIVGSRRYEPGKKDYKQNCRRREAVKLQYKKKKNISEAQNQSDCWRR
jgi:hypothetical protein